MSPGAKGRPARFADALLRLELPALPPDRRRQTVQFIERRIASLPDPVAVGVGATAIAVDACTRVLGLERAARMITARPLPVLADYARLVRSLGFAFIWETWPDTRPDGAAR